MTPVKYILGSRILPIVILVNQSSWKLRRKLNRRINVIVDAINNLTT